MDHCNDLGSYLIKLLYSNRNNPVSITVMLQFGGIVSISEYQQMVAGIIFEDAPRFRYFDSIGHLVGDLLVYYDSWETILHGKEFWIYYKI